MKLTTLFLFIVFLSGSVISPAQASFHLMQIEQVIGGVDGDPTIQAIQLRMRSSFQNLVQNSRLVAWDASGANPVILISPSSSVPNHGAGVRILIASANFANATDPTANPDFIMNNLIPAPYLDAGSITFENSTGTIIYWRLSWGGVSYMGATTGSITNDSNGEFGPSFAGSLPSTDTQAVLFQGGATALSTNNVTDYVLTGGAAVFINNAGSNFTVQSTVSGLGPIAIESELLQNYPNPFEPSTTIDYALSEPGEVTLSVYDVGGRLVRVLASGEQESRHNRVTWDGQDANGRMVASGVYFYKLLAKDFSQTRKMVLLR